MALINNRNIDQLTGVMLQWLRSRYPTAEHIDLPAPTRPEAGGSSETYFLTPTIREAGCEVRGDWVLRIEATDFRIYQFPSVERQFQVMKVLRSEGLVPVPQVLFYEADPTVLGAPFFLMERVGGRVPSDFWHARGLFAESTVEARRTMWRSAIRALASLHRSQVEPYQFLARPQLGRSGLTQELAFWEGYFRWSSAPVRPVQERALEWLKQHLPRSPETGLAWGDARFSNLVFRDNDCVAMIDWETVSLAGAGTDLGWWLFNDWMMSDGYGHPRLEGIGGRSETIEAWEEFAGRKAQDLEWQELFATWRFNIISDRARHLVRQMQPDNALAGQARSIPAERLQALLES